jgi:hypothetical protein
LSFSPPVIGKACMILTKSGGTLNDEKHSVNEGKTNSTHSMNFS